MSSPKLIVVDDDGGIRTYIRNVAEEMGFEVGEAQTGKEYLDVFGDEHADMIVLDIAMPEMHGVELFDFLHDHHIDSKIIIITGYSGAFLDSAVQLATKKDLSVVGGLNKPIQIDDLEALLQEGLSSTAT